ncbi:McrB family protein [Algoriphagus sp.]|uniref:McrB family protein n=1 Tax=Algoriphagus sp. TaxID=1872435 RepID=UPI003918999F
MNLISELHTEVKKIQKDKSSYIYNKDAPSYGERYFYSASLAKYKEFLEYNLKASILVKEKDFKVFYFQNALRNSALLYDWVLNIRFTASLLAKPFLILTGLSGSGKTKIAQAFTSWISQVDTQYIIIPVGADWTNREPLLGYPNALNPEEYIKPENGALDLLIEANENPDLPHFLILDEMNLSHVERYFADFLSAMESDEEIFLHSGGESISGVPPKIRIPKNLFIIGTVNFDETTHMFSPKVLDRANTIEFRITPDEMTSFLNQVGEIQMENLKSKGAGMAKSFLDMALDTSVPSEGMESIKTELGKFFVELKKAGAEFGYRSATEILKLIDRLGKIDPSLDEDAKLDIAIIQKLLPKLHGSRRKLVPILSTLGQLCLAKKMEIEKDVFNDNDFKFEKNSDVKYPLSLEKLSRMHRGAIENGFASFAEA